MTDSYFYEVVVMHSASINLFAGRHVTINSEPTHSNRHLCYVIHETQKMFANSSIYFGRICSCRTHSNTHSKCHTMNFSWISFLFLHKYCFRLHSCCCMTNVFAKMKLMLSAPEQTKFARGNLFWWLNCSEKINNCINQVERCSSNK